MTLRVHAAAETDIQSAADWYDQQREGLGDEFLEAVEEAFQIIQQLPRGGLAAQAAPPGREVRRYGLKRFPYSVFYEVSDEDIIVLAVTHQRRKPGEWQTRLA
jgi:plasmid stabilization system protein ParE